MLAPVRCVWLPWGPIRHTILVLSYNLKILKATGFRRKHSLSICWQNKRKRSAYQTLRALTMASLSERLKAATHELQELEKLVVSADFSPRVLSEFRSAIDNIRQTAWAVQQWIELQQQDRDPYTVLGILSVERVRRATQITKDLTIDLESMEVSLETEGMANLFHAIEALHERLTPLFKRK